MCRSVHSWRKSLVGVESGSFQTGTSSGAPTSLVLSRCTLVEQQNKYWKFSSVASTEGYTQPSAQCWGLWAKRHMISTKMHTKYHIEAHCPVLRLNNKAKIWFRTCNAIPRTVQTKTVTSSTLCYINLVKGEKYRENYLLCSCIIYCYCNRRDNHLSIR